jgi:Ni,Fe-hydrogenase III large subunit
VYGRLRTPIVNFFQEWGGNRLAKGLIRPGKMNYPFSMELSRRLLDIFSAYERDFNEMSGLFFQLPSVLARLERTGIVNYEQVLEIGTVGMSARMSGLGRDIRKSHPFNMYQAAIRHEPILKSTGDVFSRAQIRNEEITQSSDYCKRLLEGIPPFNRPDNIGFTPGKEKFTLSLVEGWRGEICHCAITDENRKLISYKIKDPSHHNWMALAQAVRNNEISDFPVCNKSFNLSYCGHDL